MPAMAASSSPPVNVELYARYIRILFADEYEIDILGDPTRGTRHQ